MFGRDAPVWAFLNRFGGAANPLALPPSGTAVIETYPVLTLIALGWIQSDSRATGRLPKYNPARKKTYSLEDWRFVCSRASEEIAKRGLPVIAGWIDGARNLDRPGKIDQDKLDACLCLIAALHLAERRNCLMIGDTQSGYIVVPNNQSLQREVEVRCKATARSASDWVRVFAHKS